MVIINLSSLKEYPFIMWKISQFSSIFPVLPSKVVRIEILGKIREISLDCNTDSKIVLNIYIYIYIAYRIKHMHMNQRNLLEKNFK